MNKTVFSTLCVAGLFTFFSTHCLAATPIEKANAFSGFYASLGLGSNLNSFSNKMSKLRYYGATLARSTDSNFPSSDIKSSASPMAFQAEGGWGKVFNQKYYYGGFAGLESANFSKEVNSSATLVYSPVSATSNNFTASNTFTLKQTTPSYVLGGKFGYLLSPKALLWAGLGLSQASFKLSATSSYVGTSTTGDSVSNHTSTTASFSESKELLGVSYAVGFEYHFLPRWNGFISDTFTSYNSMDLNGTTSVTVTASGAADQFAQVELNDSVSLFTQNIMLGATYQF